jgi:sulfur relay protein TusB/DsrH
MKLISIITPNLDLKQLSLLCQPTDAILLRQDAVYLCLRHDICWPTTQLYALASDVAVRQLTVTDAMTTIEPARWVELSCQAEQLLLWPN